MLGSAAILNVEEGRADWLATTTFERRLPIGAELRPDGGADVRVWAPRCETVTFVIESGAGESRETTLAAEPDGYFAGFVAEAGAGSRYRLRLDQGTAYPDPASRFQPEGPHGPSEIVDPSGLVVPAQ